MSFFRLDKPVQFLKGVGPVRAEALARMGIVTARDRQRAGVHAAGRCRQRLFSEAHGGGAGDALGLDARGRRLGDGPAQIGAADGHAHQSAESGGRRHRAHLRRADGQRKIGGRLGRPRGVRQGYSPGGRGRIAPPGSLGPLDARTAPVRRGMAAGQLPVTDADALKPAQYGFNVVDSQDEDAAQQFAAPSEHS